MESLISAISLDCSQYKGGLLEFFWQAAGVQCEKWMYEKHNPSYHQLNIKHKYGLGARLLVFSSYIILSSPWSNLEPRISFIPLYVENATTFKKIVQQQ